MTLSSLRLRLLVAWAVFIAITLQVAGVGLRLLFERSIARRTEVELAADLRQLRRGMEINALGAVTVVRAPTDPQFDMIFGGRYWQIAENGTPILRSPSLDSVALELPKSFVPTLAQQQTWLAGPEKQQLFAIVRIHEVAATDAAPVRQLVITTAVDGAEIREDTDKFSNELFSSLAALALLLLAGAYAHVSIGLKPLDRLRSSVVQVREGRTRRVEGAYPDEVMPLVAETNALLSAQEDALRTARQRAGDLAHGLKTPLAIMAAKSRQVRRAGEALAADDIDRQIEAMSRHVERELARARARGSVLAGLPRVDLSALVRGIVSAIQALPREPVLEWTTRIPERLSLAIDPDDFNNIAGNLIENAQKWARSEIVVTVGRSGSGVVLDVADDGPGIPCDQLKRVLERGVRADTSVAGSGLGLAIVSDLVDVYHGTLTLDRSASGGLLARVWLPGGAADQD